MWGRTAFALAVIAGCEALDHGGSSADDPGGLVMPTGATSTETPGGSDETGATGGPSTGDGGGFIDWVDVPPAECDVWNDDCPTGEKCIPWSSDGGVTLDTSRCVDIADDPALKGDACEAVGHGGNLLDDCDEGLRCWDVDPLTNTGECYAYCTGSPRNPGCEAPGARCHFTAPSVYGLCLAICDPLLQDCGEGDMCVVNSRLDGYECVPDRSGEQGAYGDPCVAKNDCNPGLLCASWELVPDCPSPSDYCCTEFCDLDKGDGQCAGVDEGQVCFPLFKSGHTPDGYESVGLCARL